MISLIMPANPMEGQVISGKAFNKPRASHHKYLACGMCGKLRWVACDKMGNKTIAKLCKHCSATMIRGPRIPYIAATSGYRQLWVSPNDFFYSMADSRGYVAEHRLVMAKLLGRCLHRWEPVHHINGIKDDNRIENLQLMSELGHRQLTALEDKIDKQTHLIEDLRKEIRLLRWSVKQDVLV